MIYSTYIHIPGIAGTDLSMYVHTRKFHFQQAGRRQEPGSRSAHQDAGLPLLYHTLYAGCRFSGNSGYIQRTRYRLLLRILVYFSTAVHTAVYCCYYAVYSSRVLTSWVVMLFYSSSTGIMLHATCSCVCCYHMLIHKHNTTTSMLYRSYICRNMYCCVLCM